MEVGKVGVAYFETLVGSGGTSPFSYSISSGTLPNGLSLNTATGVISGTPTAANGSGTYFTARVTDANGCSVSRAYSLKICPVLSLNPASLETAIWKQPYVQDVAASGGTAPYVYALANGTLPDGVEMDTATGRLSGTPSTLGSSTFTVSVTDANGCAGSRSYTLTVACEAITITPETLPMLVPG